MNGKPHIDRNYVRLWGSQHRETVASIHAQFGHDAGYRGTRRFIYEAAKFIAEIHGTEAACSLLYSIGDAMVGGNIPADVSMPEALRMVGKEFVAAADHGACEVIDMSGVLDDRIAETSEWLARHGGAKMDRPTETAERVLWNRGYLAALSDIKAKAESS